LNITTRLQNADTNRKIGATSHALWSQHEIRSARIKRSHKMSLSHSHNNQLVQAGRYSIWALKEYCWSQFVGSQHAVSRLPLLSASDLPSCRALMHLMLHSIGDTPFVPINDCLSALHCLYPSTPAITALPRPGVLMWACQVWHIALTLNTDKTVLTVSQPDSQSNLEKLILSRKLCCVQNNKLLLGPLLHTHTQVCTVVHTGGWLVLFSVMLFSLHALSVKPCSGCRSSR